ncbi:MAG: flagellar motor protein MotB [Candidatus Marinimicrobia bacterium]|nr:flagellar motor protein MotB [Candidatus Neomarinimicrobiota bacterium]
MADEEEEEISGEDEAEECDCGKKGLPGWMGTYADMVTLLFAFFVLLFAMSSVNEIKFEQLMLSLSSAIGTDNVPDAGTRAGLEMASSEDEKEKTIDAVDELGGMVQAEMDDIVSEVEELVMFNELQGAVDVTSGNDGVIITLSDVIIFRPGEARISPAGKRIIEKIADILRQFVYTITIEGHTDNVPMRSGKFSSNWELSGMRAVDIVHILVEMGVDPGLISARAFSQYQPIAPNDTPENRAKNRRIEIVYERKTIEQQMQESTPDTLIFTR